MSIPVTLETPRTSIVVQGIQVQSPQPFAEGHTLRENEADVLNQTYAENIRNNLSTKFRALIEAKAREMGFLPEGTEVKDLTEEQKAEVIVALGEAPQETLEEYIASYDFGVRRSGGGATRAPVDPVEKEAFELALTAVKAALAKAGQKIKDVGLDAVKKKAKEVFEANREVLLERARVIVDARKQAGASALDVEI